MISKHYVLFIILFSCISAIFSVSLHGSTREAEETNPRYQDESYVTTLIIFFQVVPIVYLLLLGSLAVAVDCLKAKYLKVLPAITFLLGATVIAATIVLERYGENLVEG